MNFLEQYRIEKNKGNYYKVYDIEGNFLYNINQEDEKKLKNEYLKGVTCFVVNKRGEILIEKRGNTEFAPGKIDLVSGHVDNDEVGMQAMIRELREETNISEQNSINIHKIDIKPLSFKSNGLTRNFFIEFYYLLIENEEVNKDSKEVAELHWIPMEKVFEMIKQGKTKFPKQGHKIDYEPIFEVVREAILNREQLQERSLGE